MTTPFSDPTLYITLMLTLNLSYLVPEHYTFDEIKPGEIVNGANVEASNLNTSNVRS